LRRRHGDDVIAPAGRAAPGARLSLFGLAGAGANENCQKPAETLENKAGTSRKADALGHRRIYVSTGMKPILIRCRAVPEHRISPGCQSARLRNRVRRYPSRNLKGASPLV